MEVYGAYRANVALIRDAIGENKHQMDQVNASLVTFQTGLLGVEREMLPIYKLTEKLRETQKNIDLCVQELHSVNENFIAAQTLAPTLLNGSKFDQEEYVRALQKLLVAIGFLESHRAYEGSGKALDQAKDLLSQARKKFKADFLSAISILSRGSRDEDGRVVWSKPSKQELAKVTQLLRCLLSSNIDQNELLGDYGKQRFQVIKMLLCDDAATNSMQFFVKQPVSDLSQRLGDIEATIQAEKTLAEAIFSTEELYHAAFRCAAHPILESIKRDLETSIQSQSTTKSQQPEPPFNLLLIHELLSSRVKEVEAMTQPPLLLRDRKGKGLEDPWVLSKSFANIVANVALATKERLFAFQVELTESIGVGDRSLSKDANVHPVSSHMINFLRQLCELTKPLKVLLGAKDSNVSPLSFVETVIMQLVEALQSKTTQFKGRADLKHLFLANNFAYIANSLPRCEDKEIEAQLKTEIKSHMEEMRDRAITQFIQASYQSFETFLCDPKEKLVYAKGGSLLTLESGRLLKEKFARFNTQIEDIHETQSHFIVSEPHIRHQLIQAAVDAIIPRYTSFYEKYSTVHFSKKNSSKYLKYTPRAAEQLLKELFLGEVMRESK
ncbi:hypothetical protein Poli38472_004565 [Pythium oligandrum]|uniref:Exocyst subunit Exo70 family protein n=1 Tax=Pythium oligandrum TaxID=41045 RepID=A0A8K1CA55_PYTOL|nr:hypothetical protein Poli38472_004565 [Pythium oligandrum]|eukprot:TMW59496.1 hypothetical protein Poli38472_004565 [Pythium oligandrum]